MKKVQSFEPWFFLFFGFFHMHRIWGLFDREAYASFWLGVMETGGVFYYALMALLGGFSILGIAVFLRDRKHAPWWRWIYIFGGSYLLFDLIAISLSLDFWHTLLLNMYDTTAPYWNALWLFFILMGAGCLVLAIWLFRQRKPLQTS